MYYCSYAVVDELEASENDVFVAFSHNAEFCCSFRYVDVCQSITVYSAYKTDICTIGLHRFNLRQAASGVNTYTSGRLRRFDFNCEFTGLWPDTDTGKGHFCFPWLTHEFGCSCETRYVYTVIVRLVGAGEPEWYYKAAA